MHIGIGSRFLRFMDAAQRCGISAAVLVIALLAGCGPESEGVAPAEAGADASASVVMDAGEELASKSEALTLAPIFAASDTSVRQANPYANDGIGVNLSVSSVAGAEQRTLLRFDPAAVASAVGTEAVYKATVEVTIAALPEGWGGGALSIHPMTWTWIEGNGTFGGFGTQGPSWACRLDTDTSNPTAA